MLNIKFGIQKRQWLILLTALAIPILVNAAAIWRDVGTKVILQILRGNYGYHKGLEIDGNPFPEILLNLILNIIPLGLLAWLMIFLSNKVFFQKQQFIAKLFEGLLAAWLVATVFETITGFFMPFVWLPRIHNTLGLPGSQFVSYWSHWLVFPATAIILFAAILLSGMKKKI